MLPRSALPGALTTRPGRVRVWRPRRRQATVVRGKQAMVCPDGDAVPGVRHDSERSGRAVRRCASHGARVTRAGDGGSRASLRVISDPLCLSACVRGGVPRIFQSTAEARIPPPPAEAHRGCHRRRAPAAAPRRSGARGSVLRRAPDPPAQGLVHPSRGYGRPDPGSTRRPPLLHQQAGQAYCQHLPCRDAGPRARALQPKRTRRRSSAAYDKQASKEAHDKEAKQGSSQRAMRYGQ